MNSVSNINSLASGRPACHFKTAIFNLVLLIDFFRSSNDNAPRWMSLDLRDDKSTLVQVMAWCRQATSHYLSQCWPSSMTLYGVTRPQWVNETQSALPNTYEGLVQQIMMIHVHELADYHQTSNIRCAKSKNLHVSRFVLQLCLHNPLIEAGS